MAKADPCTSVAICSPSPGASLVQDELTSVIWNPKMTYPFDQYEKVDIYIVDDNNSTRAVLLQKNVDLNLGMTAARLEASFFPNDVPLNRSCHIMMIGNGNELDGTHQTLNSSSFYMIRTKELVSGTLVPITGAPTTSSVLATSTVAATPSKSGDPTPTPSSSVSNDAGAFPTNLPSSPQEKENALSPLVIGLISAACVVLMIAVVAIGLLFRAQRRSKGKAGHFKSLHDHPSSPTDDTSKSSLYKGHHLASEASFIGPVTGSAITTGRSSSTTARSAEPMVKGAPSILGFNSHSPTSPVAPMPLLERKPSTHNRAESATAAEGPRIVTGDVEEAVRPQQASALTAGDAQLIAETFRKSMRRPRWEENDTDADEEEQDEARRAANQLLREELSEQGLDVRRGVQRRVTIQDRVNRQSVPAPISHTVSIPDAE